MFLNRDPTGELPTLTKRSSTSKPSAKLHRGRDNCDAANKKQFDKRASLLPPLAIGDAVRVQDPITHKWEQKARVRRKHADGRSYEIEFEDGYVSRRNRRFLKLRKHFQDETNETVRIDKEKVTELPGLARPEPRRSARLKAKAQA